MRNLILFFRRLQRKGLSAPLVLLFSLFFLSSCEKEDPVFSVDMPATPVLTVRANWGLVTSPYLRVRKQPKVDGEVVAHLRNASVAEILAKTTYPETLEGETDYWYEISSEGLRGWVFGSYLDFYDSKSKAEQAARMPSNG